MRASAMVLRPMTSTDVPAAHAIRLRVRENKLSDPSVVTEADHHTFMARDTRSWLCENDGNITGFAMVDLEKGELWALIVAPEHEGRGIGRSLQDAVLDLCFAGKDRSRLTTAPDTRAEAFYRSAGYADVGRTRYGEIIFELQVAHDHLAPHLRQQGVLHRYRG